KATRFPKEGGAASSQSAAKANGASGLARRAVSRGRDRPLALVDLQGDEAKIALAVDEQQDRFAPGFARIVDLGGDLRRVLHLFLRHFDDEIAGAHALLRGRAVGRDVGDDDARRILGDRKALAQLGRQIGHRQAERLDGARRLGRWLLLARRQRRLLVGLIELADLDVDLELLALAPDLDLHRLVDRRFGDDAWQATHIGHLLAVEGEDDVAGLNAGHLGRTAIAHARDEGAFRLVEAEALGDLVGDALDVDAEPAAPRVAKVLELLDDRP